MPDEVSQDKSTPEGVQPATSSGVTLIEHPAEVHVYSLTEDQLARLAQSGVGRTINLNFAGILFGSIITLIAVLLTVDFDKSGDRSALVSILIALSVLFVFFAIKAGLDVRNGNQDLERITGVNK